MFRVIYTSQATRSLNAADITALSLVCRRNNAHAGLTGLLVFHEDRFLQILEGEAEELTPRMAKIARDPRHRRLAMIENGPIAQRAFVTWRVGFLLPQDLSRLPSAAFALSELVPPDSDFRGRDPLVRDHVRRFLASLRDLPIAAAG